MDSEIKSATFILYIHSVDMLLATLVYIVYLQL